MSAIPSLPNSEGTVIILNAFDEEIDLFDYNEGFHSPLLDNVDGVSLERIRFSGTSNDPNNWQSASSTVGFATPGLENSQSQATPDASMTLNIDPPTFSPDIAGMANFTTINFEFDSPGNVLNVTIFDSRGNPVKHIARNSLVGAQGFFRWDGTTNAGDRARVGYYLILFEIISPDGQVERRKERVVIGTRF